MSKKKKKLASGTSIVSDCAQATRQALRKGRNSVSNMWIVVKCDQVDFVEHFISQTYHYQHGHMVTYF